MVHIISRWERAGTTSGPRRSCPEFRSLSYDEVFNRRSLPHGTYIFSDLDRLSPFELELAAVIYRVLRDAGAAVMNDPAVVLTRYDLLRTLHREGINAFNVYRPLAGEWPERYPVFLRREAFHMGPLTDLLESRNALEVALSASLDEGVPHSSLIAVEYAAEKTDEGLFRKHSVYRIGEHCFQDTSVNQREWIVKSGESGVANDGFYADELRRINEVPFEATVRRVFELAKIEYGRVDIGMFMGRPQFYEVNTNPTVGFETRHRSADRTQSRQTFCRNYKAAIQSIEPISDGPSIPLDRKVLRRCRRKYRWFKRLLSRPSY